MIKIFILDEEKIKKEEMEWKIEKNLIKRKNRIDEERALLKRAKKISTTKWLISFLFLNCTIIEIFTGWTIIQSLRLAEFTGLAPDFTPLVTLIGAVVGEVIGFAVYAAKSAKENTKNGINYMKACQDMGNNNING